jgi:Family of unknown function (DUF6335)
MAKAKTRRMGGRKAAGPKRATSPARSKKSKKTLKKRAKQVAKAPRRAARKASRRQASARRSRSSVRVKANRRMVSKRSAAKAVARRSAARRPAARKVASAPVRKAAAPVKKTARPAKSAGALVVRKAKVVPRASASKPPAPSLPAPAARKAPAAPPLPTPTPRVTRKAARSHAKPPALERQRRHLPEADVVPTPPSSLDLNRTASAARSGQAEIAEHLANHTETGPELTAGDVDASWESAYSTGDEAPGGDNPTPDQDIVDDIGKSLGVVYEDSEELKGADKITERDKHRWELDPASAEDFKDR